MAPIRIILHGKAASDARLRAAVHTLRKDGQVVEVRVTWEPGDAVRLTGEAVAEAVPGKFNCIVAGGGDGTINEVFAAAHASGLPEGCSLGVLPMGTANWCDSVKMLCFRSNLSRFRTWQLNPPYGLTFGRNFT